MDKKTIVTLAIAAAIILIVGTGQNVTITDDRQLSGSFDTVTVSGSGNAEDWLEVDGNNATVKCLRITGQYIHVTGVNVTGCASHGVLITGKHIIFENSSVHGTVTENGAGKCSGSGGWGSAVKVQVGGEDVVIQNNAVYENCGEGIASTRGINITINNNMVRDNFSVNIYVDNTRGATVRGNTAKCSNPNYYRNGQPAGGIGLGAENYSGWGYQLRDILIENNVMEGCKAIRLYEDSAIASGSPQNVVIQNNQLVNSYQTPLVSVEIAVSINNVATVNPTLTPTVTKTATPTQPVTVTPTITPVIVQTFTPTVTKTPKPEVCFTLVPTVTIDGVGRGQVCFK